ncbi:MAG: hypothetical protein ACRDRJ_48960 [Streptosporangiaceae bacterium]
MSSAPREPGTVEVRLSGRGRDLIKVAAFLESVTRGGGPAAVLSALGLDAIETISERAFTGRGQRVSLTFQPREVAAP